MKKRLMTTLLMLVLLTGLLPVSASAASGLGNFTKVNTYLSGQFNDVTSNDWYEQNVVTAFEFGLMQGSGGSFNASGDMSVVEAIVLACRIHSIYNANGTAFTQGNPWYQVYVDYALSNGIIPYAYANYSASVTRSEMAIILSRAIPSSEFNEINSISSGAIPDVPASAPYADVVYMLYRAGILTGDANGAFAPKDKIGRHSVAAIASRIVNPSLRRTVTLGGSGSTGILTADQLYEKCAPSVFDITVSNMYGTAFSGGSGFFIDPSGIAITNYHVIDSAFGMEITTMDGKKCTDVKVLAFSIEDDAAVIKVGGSGFDYLNVGDSSKIKVGETVYAIGNPMGLTGSLTDGMISNTGRAERNNMIQITAPIWHGSSGGALLNDKGEVIGITTAGENEYVQGFNYAVPINTAMSLTRYSTPLTLREVARLGAIDEYNHIPPGFEWNYEEEEPNDTWGQAGFISNGVSMWGTIDDDLRDIYLLQCNAAGTINITLYSYSSNAFIDDILMFVETIDGIFSPEAVIYLMPDGSHMLYLSYKVQEPGYYAISLMSKSLYQYYYLNTDYEFYYEFIPI